MRQWLCFKNVHIDGVHIERSVTKLCQKVTTSEECVSELETVCGKIRKEITKMVQREVNSFRPRSHEIEVYFYNTRSPVPSFQQGGGPYYSACSLYR